ncbi:hypothetical protein PGIGA_G00242770 [Pangasianodon gigas]|uniref:Uncharacterized protein n=1 Tax=Pangasianodon gigas TaxID=30993 RepID=A0ACC5WP71_PANGG|nr:hypothetical protein [Pangasianodon gigas]
MKQILLEVPVFTSVMKMLMRMLLSWNLYNVCFVSILNCIKAFHIKLPVSYFNIPLTSKDYRNRIMLHLNQRSFIFILSFFISEKLNRKEHAVIVR